MPTDKPRFSLTVPEEIMQAIEDFRFDNRFQSRTDAVLEIIRIGLETIKERKANSKLES